MRKNFEQKKTVWIISEFEETDCSKIIFAENFVGNACNRKAETYYK